MASKEESGWLLNERATTSHHSQLQAMEGEVEMGAEPALNPARM